MLGSVKDRVQWLDEFWDGDGIHGGAGWGMMVGSSRYTLFELTLRSLTPTIVQLYLR